jgi:voltage-gated potassium channel
MKYFQQNPKEQNWRVKLHEIIFEADTPAGKWFDVLLILTILLSVITVMLDSVASIQTKYGEAFLIAEWIFTILFSIEYITRLICVHRPIQYAKSFYGIIDLLAVVPTYISLILPGTQYLIVIRILRLLRIFRILKLVQYIHEARLLRQAFRDSRRKITVFLFTVLTLVFIFGSIIYLIESPANGFTSIPRSIYWAIVTLTTVGYGDISPHTPIGQLIAALVMILGYSIIAVPTGIVTVAFSKATEKNNTQVCIGCNSDNHDNDAIYCKYCGTKL